MFGVCYIPRAGWCVVDCVVCHGPFLMSASGAMRFLLWMMCYVLTDVNLSVFVVCCLLYVCSWLLLRCV